MATKVLIISGGLTHERDVSVRSGRRVANILAQAGYEVVISDVDASLAGAIESFAPDVIWPLVHGSIGEDGSLQSFLESVGIPFVGSSSVQSMLASNKPTAKALLGSAGLATPGWVTLPQAIFRQLGASNVLSALEGSVSFPVVIKPTDGGSALGISTAHESEYFVPARFSPEALADMQAAAVEAHTTLGLRDLSRMDFVVDEDGTCWFIDANVAPGMTDTSLLPQAADALEDSSFAQLCADIVDFVAGGRVADGTADGAAESADSSEESEHSADAPVEGE